jgi:hypothetical protein
MKKIIILIVFAIASLAGFAQDNEPHAITNKSFYAEIGGPGILFSANYDSRFKKTPFGFGARIGLGFVSADESDYINGNYNYKRSTALTLPIQLNYIFGQTNSVNAFEVGLGFTYVSKQLDIFNFYEKKGTNLYGTAAFMCRRVPVNGGFSWRIGFTPLVGNGNVQASGGASVGYNF